MEISSIQQIDIQTVSSFNTVTLSGVVIDFDSYIKLITHSPTLLNLSSIMTYDLSGVPTNYIIDISGAKNVSTINSIPASQQLSTIQGLSTMYGLEALASVEVSIDDIMNSHNTLVEIESRNKTNLNSLDFTQFKTNLYKWAAQGYPDSFLTYSFPVMIPSMTGTLYNCSDGNPKNIWDYIPYCLNLSLEDWLKVYQQKVNGIKLSFSINENPYIINIHVTRL
jgi:hypothetical protein